MTDWELLSAAGRDNNADSFRQLVQRHIDFVYAAARRQASDGQTAEDITQAVFLLLWQRAARMKPETPIKGWLFKTTRYVAANARRADMRRKLHEREAAAMRLESIQPMPAPEISPYLDDALASLSERDRQAVLLRYFQDEPLAAVGQQLGISEDAAKKRVTRAVERLKRFFVARGLTVESAAMPGLLAMHGAGGAPPALMQSTMGLILNGVHGAAASGSAIHMAKGAAKMMFRNQLRILAAKCLIATACVTAATAAVVTEERHPKPKPPVVSLALETPQPTTDSSSTATEDPEYQACRGVLLGIMDGYENDDARKVQSLLYWDPATPQQSIDDMNHSLTMDVSTYRIQKSAYAHFGARASALVLRMTTLVAGEVDILSRIGPDDILVTDDEVTMTPPQSLVAMWPNKPLYFKQVGNDWKLNAGKTLRIVHKSVRRHPVAGETEEQAFTICAAEVTKKWNAIADDIDQGKIKDVFEAQARINAAYLDLAMEFRTMNCNVIPK